MICPHCQYENTEENIKLYGRFYRCGVMMERRRDYDYSKFEIEEAALYGCPVCKKTFIVED